VGPPIFAAGLPILPVISRWKAVPQDAGWSNAPGGTSLHFAADTSWSRSLIRNRMFRKVTRTFKEVA
jgi:hypothetical protein